MIHSTGILLINKLIDFFFFFKWIMEKCCSYSFSNANHDFNSLWGLECWVNRMDWTEKAQITSTCTVVGLPGAQLLFLNKWHVSHAYKLMHIFLKPHLVCMSAQVGCLDPVWLRHEKCDERCWRLKVNNKKHMSSRHVLNFTMTCRSR